MTDALAKHFNRLIDDLDEERLKQLASLVNAELDRRRLEATLDNIEVKDLINA